MLKVLAISAALCAVGSAAAAQTGDIWLHCQGREDVVSGGNKGDGWDIEHYWLLKPDGVVKKYKPDERKFNHTCNYSKSENDIYIRGCYLTGTDLENGGETSGPSHFKIDRSTLAYSGEWDVDIPGNSEHDFSGKCEIVDPQPLRDNVL